MKNIAENILEIKKNIENTKRCYNRSDCSVQLLAVSKYHPVDKMAEAIAAGQLAFGENYLQEAIDKQQQLATHPKADLLEWHFIGPIQSNKTRKIAECFQWVHTVDRLKIAQRLNEQRPNHLPNLNVCLQVNISGEESKSGFLPEQVVECALAVAALERLSLRGLMCIPAPSSDFEQQREVFAKMQALQQQCGWQGVQLDTLSMGMSDDMQAAIAEGATIVRVGSAIFGTRPVKPA